jgi:hypothetical protein
MNRPMVSPTILLLLEIERLQGAKKRALAIADERSRENVELRAEIEKLQAALTQSRTS